MFARERVGEIEHFEQLASSLHSVVEGRGALEPHAELETTGGHEAVERGGVG